MSSQQDQINVETFARVTNEELQQYEALVRMLVKENFYGSELSFEEKMAAGRIGVAVGLESYDPSQDTTLAFWIAWNVKKAILDETRRNCKQKRYFSNEEFQLEPTEGYNRRQDDEFALKIRDLDEAKKETIIENAMRSLSDEERLCVQRIALESWTQEQFALDRGVSQSWVSRLWRRSIAKMKENSGELDDWL